MRLELLAANSIERKMLSADLKRPVAFKPLFMGRTNSHFRQWWWSKASNRNPCPITWTSADQCTDLCGRRLWTTTDFNRSHFYSRSGIYANSSFSRCNIWIYCSSNVALFHSDLATHTPRNKLRTANS